MITKFGLDETLLLCKLTCVAVVLPSSLAHERVSRKSGKISLRASKAFRSTLALFLYRLYTSLIQSLKLLESLGSITDSFPIHQLFNFICRGVSIGVK